MPDIFITRKIFTNRSTVGKLTFGNLVLWTLEDSARKQKVDGKTCIPAGTYQIELRQSAHFKRTMPFLLSVPFFEGIMIHPGNTDLDSEGCILVGRTHPMADFIGQSRDAFNLLYPRIEEEMAKTTLRVCISGGFTKEEFEMAKKI